MTRAKVDFGLDTMFWLLLALTITSIVGTTILERAVREAAGIVEDNIVIEHEGKYYQTGRGGPAVSQRRLVPLDSETYQFVTRHDRISAWAGFVGIVCAFAAGFRAIIRGIANHRRQLARGNGENIK